MCALINNTTKKNAAYVHHSLLMFGSGGVRDCVSTCNNLLIASDEPRIKSSIVHSTIPRKHTRNCRCEHLPAYCINFRAQYPRTTYGNTHTHTSPNAHSNASYVTSFGRNASTRICISFIRVHLCACITQCIGAGLLTLTAAAGQPSPRPFGVRRTRTAGFC